MAGFSRCTAQSPRHSPSFYTGHPSQQAATMSSAEQARTAPSALTSTPSLLQNCCLHHTIHRHPQAFQIASISLRTLTHIILRDQFLFKLSLCPSFGFATVCLLRIHRTIRRHFQHTLNRVSTSKSDANPPVHAGPAEHFLRRRPHHLTDRDSLMM